MTPAAQEMYVKLKPLPDVDERREAFLAVAEWSRDDLNETETLPADENVAVLRMLPADEYVAVIIRQLYDIIAEDDERSPRAWDAICALCDEYKLSFLAPIEATEDRD